MKLRLFGDLQAATFWASEGAALEVDPLFPVESEIPINILIAISLEVEIQPPSKATDILFYTDTGRDNNVYNDFKPLNFVVICYTAKLINVDTVK